MKGRLLWPQEACGHQASRSRHPAGQCWTLSAQRSEFRNWGNKSPVFSRRLSGQADGRWGRAGGRRHKGLQTPMAPKSPLTSKERPNYVQPGRF